MFAMAIYTLIIVGSAFLASWAGIRVFSKLVRDAELPATLPQLAISISALAFLTVVSMPAGVMIAALVLTVTGALMKPEWTVTSRALGLPLLAAVLLATIGVWESPGAWPAQLPLGAALLGAAVVFGGILEIGRRAQPSVLTLGGITAFALLPLIAAPLVFSTAHSSLATDAAILLTALLGGMILLPDQTNSSPMVRFPVALFIAYGSIQAMHYGAWPLGIAALAIFAGGIRFAPQRAPGLA